MKFNKILTLPALALTLFGLGACTDEVKYEPAQPEANVEAFFSAATGSTVSLDNDQNTFSVPVYRTSSAGAMTVSLSGSSTDNLFSIPSDITFADGSDEASIPVAFNFSSIEANKDYTVTITIDDAVATPYGKRTQSFNVKYAPWSAWKVMNGYAEWTTPFNGGTFEISVAQRTNLLDPTKIQIRTVAAESDADGLTGIAAWDNAIVYDVDTETGLVSLPLTDTGEAYSGGGTIWTCDQYTYYSRLYYPPTGTTAEDYKDKSFFDSETGVLTIAMAYFVVDNGKVLGSYGTFTEFLQLPGYPDYSMYFANNGTQITEKGEELAVLTIAKGSDVNGFALKLVPGYLSDAQIEKVADKIKEDENVTLYYEGGDFTFPIAEDGDQTLVAVTYNAMGEPIGVQSYHFYYEIQMKDWNEGWTSLGKMIYTDYLVFTKPLSWEVEVQQNDEEPGYLRIVKPYGACPGLEPEDIERGHYYIYLDVTDPDKAMILPSVISYSALTIVSESYVMKEIGESTDADVASAGMWGTWKDNTLTMPAGSFGFYRGLTDTGWGYYVLNDAKAVVLKPVPADDDDDEPGLGTQSLSAPAVKAATYAGTNGFPVKKSKDAKKNRKFVAAAPLQF